MISQLQENFSCVKGYIRRKDRVSRTSLDTLQFIRCKAKVSSVVLCRTSNKEKLYIISKGVTGLGLVGGSRKITVKVKE